MVAAATMANNYATYAGVGFNVNQTTAGGTAAPTLTPTGTALVIGYSGTYGSLPLRVQLTDGTSRWCYEIKAMPSPVTISYTSFNTACWDNSGTAYAKQPINALQLEVAGASAAGSYNISLTSVKEN